MSAIRTHDDQRTLREDADALDAIQHEAERDGHSAADLAAVTYSVLAARRAGYASGLSTARPAVAVLTTLPARTPQVFCGYWQPDGSWHDGPEGGPGGLGLTETIEEELGRGEWLTPGASLSVMVAFYSFRGECPDPRCWDRESVKGGISLPTCRGED
jgi:hypothetical protein